MNSEGGKIKELEKNIGQDQFKETKQAEEDAEDGNEVRGDKQGQEGEIGEEGVKLDKDVDELKYKTNDKTDTKACEQISTLGKPSNKNTENMLPNPTKRSFDQQTEEELQKRQQQNSELQLPLVSYTTLLGRTKLSTYQFVIFLKIYTFWQCCFPRIKGLSLPLPLSRCPQGC